jgi:peptidoglycan L-alanyl-D-glutamate endopeptidase CwlK
MGASRSLLDLEAQTRLRAEAMLSACADDGIDVLVTCTYRDDREQARLYAQGRTAPGRIVTNKRPGQSLHNIVVDGMAEARALDVVPMVGGRPVWGVSGADLALWMRVGEIGESCGLEWAGRWRGALREFQHFQFKG